MVCFEINFSRQDFRTAPYINYAYSFCSKETIGITMVRRWDCFALFLLVLYFLSKSIWALPKSSNFREKIRKI